MSRRVDVVLFDADGVLQRPSPERHVFWRERLGPDADLDAFVRDIFVAEWPAVSGSADFGQGLAALCENWSWPGSVDEIVESWTLIDVVPEIQRRVSALRSSGVACHLASNQESNRARHMSETLGYRELFEQEFYSCQLGLVKPDADYFRHILSEIDCSADRVLFLDDRSENVEAAARVGLHAVRFDLAEMDATHMDEILERFAG